MPYYARIGGKKYGPLASQKIKQLAAAGKIAREDELSKDGQAWYLAGDVPGLFPPAELLMRPAVRVPTVVRDEPIYEPQPTPQIVVQAPAVQQTTVVHFSGQRHTNTVAIIAGFFALSALAFCWIPFAGLLVIPVACWAIFLAALAGFIALFRGGVGLLGSMVSGAIGILAIAVSLFSTAAATTVATVAAVDAADQAISRQRERVPIGPTRGARITEPQESIHEEPLKPFPIIANGFVAPEAGDEPDQAIEVEAEAETTNPNLRTWTNASGRQTTEAEFISKGPAGVKLRKANGSEIVVPLEKLSAEDQEWIAKRAKRQAP